MKKKRNRRLLLQTGLMFFLISLVLGIAQVLLLSTSTIMGYIEGTGNGFSTDISPKQADLLIDMLGVSVEVGTVLIVVFATALLVGVWLLVLRPMRKEQHIMRDYTGDKDAEKTTEMLSQIKSRNEIGVLADDISDMVQNLQDYTARIEQMAAEKSA